MKPVFCQSLLTLCFLLACFLSLPAQTFTGNQKDIDQILENIQKFSSYVMNAEVDKIANAYTADGKIFPNNRDIIEGREGLIRYWTSPEGYQTTYHKITPSEITIQGETAMIMAIMKEKVKILRAKNLPGPASM